MPECMSQSPWSTVTTSIADVAADRAGDLRERAAEVGVGVARAVVGGAPRRGRTRRRRRTSTASPRASGERSSVPQRAQRAPAPAVVATRPRRGAARRRPRRPTSSAPGRRARSASTPPAEVEALERGAARRRADQPVQPAAAADEPGSASSTASIAAKWERLGAGRPVACTAASVPASHSGSSGASSGCRPNVAVAGEQPVGGHGDPRPGRVVGRVGVRHDQGQPVGGAAQRQHDEDGAAPGSRPRRTW